MPIQHEGNETRRQLRAVVVTLRDRFSAQGSPEFVASVLRTYAPDAIAPGSWPPFLTDSRRPFSPPMAEQGAPRWRGYEASQ